MFVEVMEVKTRKKDVVKYLLNKMPLMSRVAQFNTTAKDVHIEYIEFKVLSYEVVSKEKKNKLFRYNKKKDQITMLVNTYNGYTQSIDMIPITTKKYVSKSCIKRSKVDEDKIIVEVKNQIINFLSESYKSLKVDKLTLHDINITEIKSIYKPYWVADYNGKSIFIDA